MPTLLVKGKVVTTDGEPLDRKVVEIRPRVSANQYGSFSSTMTTSGVYMATYTTTGSETAFDVEIVVTETDGEELGRSVLLYDVSGEITVDIIIGEGSYRGRSEYRRIEARIGALRGTLLIENLTAAHIEYLAAKLDVEPIRVAQYIQARRMSVELNEDVADWVFYAFMRQGLPADLPQLLAQPRAVHAQIIAEAIAANVVMPVNEAYIEGQLNLLAEHGADSAVWADIASTSKSKFRRLLDTAAGPEAAGTTQLKFMQKHLASTDTVSEFWDEVATDPLLGTAVRDTYQWTIQISTLANDHMPLIQALQAKRETVGDPIKSFRDLADLTVAQWVDLLDGPGTPIGAPPSIPTDWPEEDRIQRYAETLERIVADTYPTTVLHKRIVRDHDETPGSISGAADLIQFFENNPNFEFGQHELDSYLAENEDALDGVIDASATRANLKKIQRLSRLAPRGLQYKVVKPLYQAGIHSALQIGRMSQKSFVRKYGPSLGADLAAAVHQRAARSSSIALMLAMQFAHGFNQTPIGVIPSSQLPDYSAHPDLASLFGNLDFCSCEHCRSVYSPTAYFVDLLQFLRNQPGKVAGDDSLDALKERRLELTRIELSCINTNTEVPYIDLVNELLEFHASRHATVPPTVADSFWQTTWTAEDLAIRPEHQVSAAYQVAAGIPYPQTLPFDLPFTETTLYHQSFDVSRERMVFAYPKDDSNYSDRRARARLGLDETNWAIIVASGLVTWAPKAYWGWEPDQAGWVGLLQNVSTFLKRAELDIAGLATLLRTRFIGRVGLGITYAAPPDDCNLEEAEITGLTEADLNKIHRFIRLQQKLGWTAETLDVALHALGGVSPTLNASMMRKLAVVHRLAERLKLPLDVLLALWSPITTHTPADDSTKPSFYAARFINRVLAGSESTNFALSGTPPDLTTQTGSLSSDSRISTVQSALGISGEQATLLDQWIDSPAGTDLSVLSKAYRRVVLAKALGLSLTELRRLIDITGISPFREDAAAPTEANLADTEAFLDAVAAVRSSAFTSEHIAYLLRHSTPLTPGVAPRPEVRTPFLVDLAAGLTAIADKYAFAAGALGEGPLAAQLFDTLTEILTPEEVTAAIKLVNRTSAESDGAQEARIAAHFDLDNDAHLLIFDDVSEAQDKLTPGAGELTEAIERYEYVVSRLFAALRKRQSRDLVVQRLAQHFGLAVDSMQALLSDYLTTPSSLLDFFAEGPLLDAESAPLAAAVREYERVHKSARVISGFGFDAAQLDYLYGEGGDAGWLDLDQLPSGEEPITPLAFAGWRRLYDVTRARDLFPHHPSTLTDLRAASGAAIGAIIAERLGWDATDVAYAIDHVHDLDDAAFDDEVALLAVAETVLVARQLLTPVRRVKTWADNEPSTNQAEQMRNALHGRYDESTWRQVARSIQDELRIQQRDALVATLIAKGIATTPTTKIASADELYAYLLVDVEMSVCMTTSRIRFALSSVQQFIQRAFLALEVGLTFDEDAEAEWKWMKHYRVWEANRKVFLYPENWIEPGLRDDKSPFFRELEETLLQGDVTKSLAETAYVAYLEKLQDVALPEVMGMYHEHEKVGTKVVVNDVHVVARTGHGPYRHYYRKLHDLTRWTAWEELPGDVQGEHILPFVYGGRLYVFWIEFQLESEPPKDGTVYEDDTGTTPPKKLTVRLFWIENRDGVWTNRYHAEGCVLSLGAPEPNMTVDELRNDYACSVEEISEDSALIVNVAHTRFVDQINEYVEFKRVGGFKLLPHFGRFSIDPGSWHDSVFMGFRVNLVAQRLVSSDKSPIVNFLVYNIEDNPIGMATLFDPSYRELSVLFAHNNKMAKLTSSGFFVTGEKHRFYVVPKLRGGLGKTSKALPVNNSGLSGPWVNDQEHFPWHTFGYLNTDAGASTPKYAPDPAQPLLVADDLRVPLKWKGGIPGAKQVPLTSSIESGAASASIAVHQSMASGILGNAPTKQMQVTPGNYYDRLFTLFVFQHSYVGTFLGHIRRHGVEGLLRPPGAMNLARQQLYDVAVPSEGGFVAGRDHYKPGEHLDVSFLNFNDEVDFSYQGPYSLYNWEIFFHAPLLIAQLLTRQGRYEEADSWLRGIFDPTASDTSHEQRHWRIKPFFEAEPIEPVDALLHLLQGTAQNATKRSELEKQIKEWRDNPFNPHLLARMRNGTYQRKAVMQYIDNLIAWGDARFTDDTIESINEATQIYMLAKSILGDRPAEIKKTTAPAPKTFTDLENDLDSFSNALVELDTKAQGPTESEAADEFGVKTGHGYDPAPKFWYFCVPPNPELLAYWDVVEDRLFKIRHCQDIHGVERRLALFDPPIDPGALVKALAGGGDLASALSQLSGRAPVYRFQTYLSKAYELASEVKALGSGLLQAYEKRDAEELALLNNQHERAVLALSRAIKVAQIEEADQGMRAAESARPIVEQRRAYYQGLIDAGWLASEQAQVDLQQSAMDATLGAGLASLLGSELGLIPNFDFGVEGLSSPVIKASFGGQQLAAVASMFAGILQTESSYNSMAAGLAGTNAGFERRLQDWRQQVAAADLELAQIDQQIASARARKVVNEKELQAHDRQIENAAVVDAFMRSKYTNTELYGWMIAKVSSLYKQAYELAYRASVAAEKAYQYELHSDESFIGFGYWDQSRSGLLAGEILALDLRRLDAAYLDNNRREYELTKRISLAQLDPYALAQLRETGSCYMNVPEYVFDLDHPGHYLRRIKMVSVALPGVTGPHVNVGCTLMLESSKIRVSPKLNADEPKYAEGTDDERFAYRIGKVEQIVTSGGQDSTGLFESNLGDPRYLPFEGAGPIGTWKVDLPGDRRQFDYRSIADVVVTIQYTAREGGGALKDAALSAAVKAANEYKNNEGSALLLRASTDYSTAWNTFLYSETASSVRELDLDIVAERFPYLAAHWDNLEITGVRLVLVTDDPQEFAATLVDDGEDISELTLASSPEVLKGLPTARWSEFNRDLGPWRVKVDIDDIPTEYKQSYTIGASTYYRFKEGAVRDLLVIVHYALTET